MSEKNINSRIILKHDSAENWSKATGFIPKQGEIIVYDIDNTYYYERIKVGDGAKNVNALPFVDDALRTELLAQIGEVDGKVDAVTALVGDESVSEQINSALIVNQLDWSVNDETSPSYVRNRTHYIGDVPSIIIPETTITIDSGEYIQEDSFGFVVGENYLVNWDGTDYKCKYSVLTVEDGLFFNVLGNASILGPYNNTGEPFIIVDRYDNTLIAVMVDDGDYTISISEFIEGIVQLDEMFIPSTIARTPKMTTISIPAANWKGSSNPWSQIVTVRGVTENSKVDLQPTAVQIVELQNDEITLMAENDDGVITVYAIGDKPSVDYSVQALITEVVPV